MLKEIATHLRSAKKIAVLTGAGISAESGIPTFRDGAGGLWNQFSPTELACQSAFLENPKRVYGWYKWRHEVALQCKPNVAHQILAKWENRFPEFHPITQNVDGLHHRAGSRRLTPMHGSIHKMKCFSCHYRCDWVDHDEVPNCPECTNYLRPDIVWFGEHLDLKDLDVIDRAVEDCEFFIAIGTSGHVYPAAGLLDKARFSGAKTLVINPDPDSGLGADFFLQDKATTALTNLDNLLSNPHP